MTDSHTHTITLTRYGIAEVMKWCTKRNNNNIPGTDAPAFQRMQAELDAVPKASDYFTLDNYWKVPVEIAYTHEEIHPVDRCLYDNPNAAGDQNPAVRYRFWVECHANDSVGAGEEKK